MTSYRERIGNREGNAEVNALRRLFVDQNRSWSPGNKRKDANITKPAVTVLSERRVKQLFVERELEKSDKPT